SSLCSWAEIVSFARLHAKNLRWRILSSVGGAVRRGSAKQQYSLANVTRFCNKQGRASVQTPTPDNLQSDKLLRLARAGSCVCRPVWARCDFGEARPADKL